MTGFTTVADAAPADTLDPDTARQIEEVLTAAAMWQRSEATTPETLAFILETPRVVGLAFRHRWHDPRRPALERLHAIEYAQREDEWGQRKVYTTFGWVSRPTFEQVERHMSSPDFDTLRYRRKAS